MQQQNLLRLRRLDANRIRSWSQTLRQPAERDGDQKKSSVSDGGLPGCRAPPITSVHLPWKQLSGAQHCELSVPESEHLPLKQAWLLPSLPELQDGLPPPPGPGHAAPALMTGRSQGLLTVCGDSKSPGKTAP